MTNIDEKLSTLEQLQALLDAGAVVILRKRGDVVDVATAIPDDRSVFDTETIGRVFYEGVDMDTQWAIESATGRTLADAVRDVASLNDLPY